VTHGKRFDIKIPEVKISWVSSQKTPNLFYICKLVNTQSVTRPLELSFPLETWRRPNQVCWWCSLHFRSTSQHDSSQASSALHLWGGGEGNGGVDCFQEEEAFRVLMDLSVMSLCT
jgi:hypothetical protein